MTQQFPRSDLDWHRYFEAQFDDPAGPFDVAVQAMLRTVQEAEGKDRPGLAAAFGGFLRRQRRGARLILAEAAMAQLQLTTTQHVAFEVMQELFGAGARTDTLDRRFAEPGRDASEKHAAAARAKLASSPGVVERYGRLYAWYCSELKRRVARAKASM